MGGGKGGWGGEEGGKGRRNEGGEGEVTLKKSFVFVYFVCFYFNLISFSKGLIECTVNKLV